MQQSFPFCRHTLNKLALVQSSLSRIRSRLSLVCCLSVLLSACVATTPRDKQTPAESIDVYHANREQQLLALDQWQIKAKLGVRTSNKGGSATFLWDYSRTGQRIEIFGLFGGGRFIIEETDGSAELRDSQKNVVKGKSAQQLLDRQLGFRVPLDSLCKWVMGLVAEGGLQQIRRDEAGYPISMVQDDWVVRIRDYKKYSDFQLPGKLNITALPGTVQWRDEKQNTLDDRLEIKVVVKSWVMAGDL